MSAARILHRLGLLFRLFDAAKQNQQQPAPVKPPALVSIPLRRMSDFNAFVIAAEAFAAAHIESDRCDALARTGETLPGEFFSNADEADAQYNKTKRALVEAYKSMMFGLKGGGNREKLH